MPLYRYQAVDSRGRNLHGMMPAVDENGLEQRLKALGLWLTDASLERISTPTEAVAKTELKTVKMSGKKLRRELIDFCTLLNFQIKTGVPLAKAIEVAQQDCKNQSFQIVLSGIQAQLEAGLQFHEALARYPGVFSGHFTSVVRAGELSSKLPEALSNLKAYLEWVDQVLADVRQATLYPAIVMTVVGAFVIMLFSFVIPRFAELLTKLNVPLPLMTQIVLGTGDVFKRTWFIILPAFLAITIGLPLGRKYSRRIALFVDKNMLKLPVFGELNLMLALSRFTHNLAVLYRSGIPILESLRHCQQGLIGNCFVEVAVGQVEQDIKAGSTISEAMHKQPVFSALLLRMVTMGENTGNLDHALENVANYYNEVIPRRIKAIFSILEPALMLFLIFVVGCIALSIYLPILTLMSSIRK
jgi:type II secretory pathway component PulF